MYQDICRKFTRIYVAVTPVSQSAPMTAATSDVHEVLCTFWVVQMQPVSPHTLQAPIPPSASSPSRLQVVQPRNNVQEYDKAYNASIGTQWFCLCGKKLSRLVRPSSSTFEQHCQTSQPHLHFMQENCPPQPRECSLLTFFGATSSSCNSSLQSTPTMHSMPMDAVAEQSILAAYLPLTPPCCLKLLPCEIKDVNHYRVYIHYYGTHMRRPHGFWLMAWAWNR